MTIPEAFIKISNMFHQDLDLIFESVDEAVLASVSELTAEERLVAKNYLDELLSGNYTDEQLADIWDRTPGGSGGFGIRSDKEGGAAYFLGMLRSALESSLAEGKPK